jgi:HD domain-containing protein
MRTLKVPSSPIADAAMSAARDDAHPSLFNHSVRTYWHARSIAEKEGVLGQLSEDLLFAATMLHDMGASARAPGRERFEIEGADIAAGTLLGIGVCETDVEQVWDAIALHTSAGLAERRGVLPRIVRAGVLADFVPAAEESERFQADLHAAWPRLNVETVLVDSIIARAQGAAALPHYGMAGVIRHERTAHGITDAERAARELGW